MNLLFRFIRFLVSSIFHFLIAVVSAILRYLLVVLNTIFRFVLWPSLVAVLRIMRDLLFSSFTATITGPRQYTDRLASEWTLQILQLGISREYINQVHSLCVALSVSRIVLGWVIAALFTVAVLRVVFGLFI